MSERLKKLKGLKKKLEKRKDLDFVKELHEKLSKATVYLVGGAVRDFIYKKKVTDLDFVVEGVEKKELERFLSKKGHLKDVESRAFGVFIFRPKNGEENFDIALPRSDKWTGGGYKDLKVDTSVSLKKDLKRRDFTINAMAVNLRDYSLLDLFKGQRDLKKGIIRTVGRPEERFREDPTRILRGIRFANQLGFKIEEATFKAMAEMAKEVVRKTDDGKKRVAEELAAEEFLKSFDADTVSTIKLFDKTGLLKILLPELEKCKGVKHPEKYHSEGDVYKHTLLCLKELEKIENNPDNLIVSRLKESNMLDESFSIELKLALLFHDIGKPATFTPPNEEKDRISFNEHDEVSKELAKDIIERLKLTIFPKESRLHVRKEQVLWLIKKHMILVVAKPEEMRLSTLEKYFFNPDNRGKKLMTLSYCDISATVPKKGSPDFSLLRDFLEVIDKVKEEVKAKQKEDKLPKPLLNGNEIMEILNLKPGPKVGEIKKKIRDRELSGKLKSKKEAKKWLEKNFS